MSQNKVNKKKATNPKEYRSVSEMVHDLAEDKAFAGRVARRIAERNLTSHLMGLRAAAGMSQSDIAAKMKCTQSRISKLENGKDDDLRIGDFHAYADVLGLEMTIVLLAKDRTIVDEVKYHACAIGRRLKLLAKLAAKDATIAKGVKGFIGEAACNLARIVENAANMVGSAAEYDMIPSVPKEDFPPIHVESPGEKSQEDCEEKTGAERRREREQELALAD